MNREDKLFGEMTPVERAQEKAEFLKSFAYECGGTPAEYVLLWEEYLNQEGYTARDERILMLRDQQVAAAVDEVWPLFV